MEKKIITISREFGSGGRTVGRMVAERLGIPFYDKKLVQHIAEESGFAAKYVEEHGEHAPGKSAFSYAFAPQGVPGVMNGLSTDDYLWNAQCNVILQLAEEGPCVILGRCGDYVLRDRKDVLRVFIYAPVEWRRELAKTDPLVKAHDEKGIKEEIEKTDRNRSAYYNYYTQNRWGDAHNYDLAINAALGRETCVKMILDAVAAKEKAAEK